MRGKLAILLTALMLDASGVLAEVPDQKSDSLRMGYSGNLFTDANHRDALVAVELWAENLAVQIEKRVTPQITLFGDPEAIVHAIQVGEVDLLSLSTLDYLRIRDRVALEPALVSVIGKEAEQKYILLVRQDREIESLEELRDGELMVEIGKSEDSVPQLWLATQLLERGLGEAEQFFGMVKPVRKTSQAVLPVFFGQKDVALVRKSAFETQVELNLQLGQELTVLVTSPGLLPALACFTEGIDAEMKRLVQKAALTLHQSPKGKQILTMFQTEKLLPFRAEQLEPIVDLVKEYETLKKRSGGGK